MWPATAQRPGRPLRALSRCRSAISSEPTRGGSTSVHRAGTWTGFSRICDNDSEIATNMRKRLVAASVAVLLGSAVDPSAQQPTFSTKRESVRVDVLVTDRGKVVTG